VCGEPSISALDSRGQISSILQRTERCLHVWRVLRSIRHTRFSFTPGASDKLKRKRLPLIRERDISTLSNTTETLKYRTQSSKRESTVSADLPTIPLRVLAQVACTDRITLWTSVERRRMAQAATSHRRESSVTIPRRESEVVSRRGSEGSRRESAVSTTVDSDAEPRRRSSVFATPGDWKPSERDGTSNAPSVVSSRRSSFNSQGSNSRRPSVDGGATEISFGNGDYATLSPRNPSPSPTNARKASFTSASVSTPDEPQVLSPEAVPSRRPSATTTTHTLPRRPSNSAIPSVEHPATEPLVLDDKPPTLERQVSICLHYLPPVRNPRGSVACLAPRGSQKWLLN